MAKPPPGPRMHRNFAKLRSTDQTAALARHSPAESKTLSDCAGRVKLAGALSRCARLVLLPLSAALRNPASFLTCHALNANPPIAGKQTRGFCALRAPLPVCRCAARPFRVCKTPWQCSETIQPFLPRWPRQGLALFPCRLWADIAGRATQERCR